MDPWQAKAHRLIADMCEASYRQANTKPHGGRYQRHRPYSVPALAQALIACLTREDEEAAKRIFVDYAATADAYKH
jgi:hypothetical protein